MDASPTLLMALPPMRASTALPAQPTVRRRSARRAPRDRPQVRSSILRDKGGSRRKDATPATTCGEVVCIQRYNDVAREHMTWSADRRPRTKRQPRQSPSHARDAACDTRPPNSGSQRAAIMRSHRSAHNVRLAASENERYGTMPRVDGAGIAESCGCASAECLPALARRPRGQANTFRHEERGGAVVARLQRTHAHSAGS